MARNVLAAERDQRFCAALAGGVARPRITWPLSWATRWKRSTCQGWSQVMSTATGSFCDARAEAHAELVIVAAEVADQRDRRTQLHR